MNKESNSPSYWEKLLPKGRRYNKAGVAKLERDYNAGLETTKRVNKYMSSHYPSRQVFRRELFRKAMIHIAKVAGGEPRRIRRVMARKLAIREFKVREMY